MKKMTALTRPRTHRRRGPIVVIAYVMVAAFILDALFWHVLAPHNPLSQNLAATLHPPGGRGGVLGTDEVGRDEFSRVLAGVRPVLEISAASVAIGAFFGLVYGVLAGFTETWVGTVMARFVDMMLSIPGIVLAILISFALRPGLETSIVAIAVVTWPGLARLVRAEVIRIRHSQFVELGTVAGLRRGRLMIYHVVPNILNAFVPFVVLDVAVAIQLEAGLSFLGYGIQPPTPELGSMLADSLTYLNQWWLAVFPGLAITLLILSITYVGQDVRDRLDPRLSMGRSTGATRAKGLQPGTTPDRATPEDRQPQTVGAASKGGAGSWDAVLEVRNLTVVGDRSSRPIVDDVSLSLVQGRVLAVVGESGSGKSSLCLAILGLLGAGLRATSGVVRFNGAAVDLPAAAASAQLRTLRGRMVGLVLQDPLSSLDPVRKVGFQLDETRRAHGLSRWHGPGTRLERRTWAVDSLQSLGFVNPDRVVGEFPSALSGGMRQRVCIGIAASAGPKVVMADEPTTALDASLRGRVLRNLLEMCSSQDMALLFVTHDLTVVRGIAEEMLVIYAGMILEEGTTAEVCENPMSPYTQALLACSITLEQAEQGRMTVPSIGGDGADSTPVTGCPFVPRCPLADDKCRTQRPVLSRVSDTHRVACWHSGVASDGVMPGEPSRI
jgi:peptide/nickel transport system permease protein